MNYLIKNFVFPKDTALKIFITDNNVFWILTLANNLFCFRAPAFLTLKKTFSNLQAEGVLISSADRDFYNKFNQSFFFVLNNVNKKYKKKLFLKGLGYKISYNDSNNNLNFKLGFSHIIAFKLHESISVKINKNVLVLESYDSISLGDSAHKIRLLKMPDVYKGKGFTFKNESIFTKPIKKK